MRIIIACPSRNYRLLRNRNAVLRVSKSPQLDCLSRAHCRLQAVLHRLRPVKFSNRGKRLSRCQNFPGNRCQEPTTDVGQSRQRARPRMRGPQSSHDCLSTEEMRPMPGRGHRPLCVNAHGSRLSMPRSAVPAPAISLYPGRGRQTKSSLAR